MFFSLTQKQERDPWPKHSRPYQIIVALGSHAQHYSRTGENLRDFYFLSHPISI